MHQLGLEPSANMQKPQQIRQFGKVTDKKNAIPDWLDAMPDAIPDPIRRAIAALVATLNKHGKV